MVRVWFKGRPVLICSSREAGQAYIERHRPEVQAQCTVKVTHDPFRKEGHDNGNG